MIPKLRSRHPIDVPHPWGRRWLLVGTLSLLSVVLLLLPLLWSLAVASRRALLAVAFSLVVAALSWGVASLFVKY